MLAWLIAGQVDSPEMPARCTTAAAPCVGVDHRGQVGDVGDDVLLAGPASVDRDDVQAAHRPAALGQPAAQPACRSGRRRR